MPQTKKTVPFLTLALLCSSVGFAALAWHFHQQLEQQKQVAAQAGTQHQTVALNRPSAENIRKGTDGETNSGETPLEGENTQPDAAERKNGKGRGESKGQRDFSEAMKARAELLNNPEVIKLMALQQRGDLDKRYAELFKKLNLPAPVLEKLKDLLVEQQNISRDVLMAARKEGMTRENRDEIEALIKVTKDEGNAAIKTLLGEELYAQYSQFKQTGNERSVVDQVEARLSYSASPLSTKQTEQLVQLLAQSTPAPAAGTESGNRERKMLTSENASRLPFPSGTLTRNASSGAAINDQVITQAAAFLSQSQIDALRQIQAEQQAQAKVAEMMSSVSNPKNKEPNPKKPGKATK